MQVDGQMEGRRKNVTSLQIKVALNWPYPKVGVITKNSSSSGFRKSKKFSLFKSILVTFRVNSSAQPFHFCHFLNSELF